MDKVGTSFRLIAPIRPSGHSILWGRMGFEIERKFLVTSETWRDMATRSERLRDGLLARFTDGKIRIRRSEDRATITIKSSRIGMRRSEYEYEICCTDAEEIMTTLCEGRLMEKTRYFVPHDGLTWVVDVYEGALAGLVIAEIELERENQTFSLPSWVGREVTGDPRFRKGSLQSNPLPKPD